MGRWCVAVRGAVRGGRVEGVAGVGRNGGGSDWGCDGDALVMIELMFHSCLMTL